MRNGVRERDRERDGETAEYVKDGVLGADERDDEREAERVGVGEGSGVVRVPLFHDVHPYFAPRCFLMTGCTWAESKGVVCLIFERSQR